VSSFYHVGCHLCKAITALAMLLAEHVLISTDSLIVIHSLVSITDVQNVQVLCMMFYLSWKRITSILGCFLCYDIQKNFVFPAYKNEALAFFLLFTH
jgi:hypothetical protein